MSSTQAGVADSTFYFNVRQFSYSSYDNYWCVYTINDNNGSSVIWDGDTKNPYFKETYSYHTNAKIDIFDRCSNLGQGFRMVGFKKFSSDTTGTQTKTNSCILIFYDYGEYISLC